MQRWSYITLDILGGGVKLQQLCVQQAGKMAMPVQARYGASSCRMYWHDSFMVGGLEVGIMDHLLVSKVFRGLLPFSDLPKSAAGLCARVM